MAKTKTISKGCPKCEQQVFRQSPVKFYVYLYLLYFYVYIYVCVKMCKIKSINFEFIARIIIFYSL